MSKPSARKVVSAPAALTDQQLRQTTQVSLYDIDDIPAHHCGYCNQNGNISVGMSSDVMRVEDYQLLIDRGWRRSGTYHYKPVMDKTCCPLYPIRCDALNVRLRKSQKIVLKTMRNFLHTGQKPSTTNQAPKSPSRKEPIDKGAKLATIDNTKFLFKQSDSKTRAQLIKESILNNQEFSQTDIKDLSTALNVKRVKAKHRRLFKKLATLKQKELINNQSDIEKYLKKRPERPDESKELEIYLKEDTRKKKTQTSPVNKLELRLVRSSPPSEEFERTLNEEHELYTKYQMSIHNDSLLECNKAQFQRFLCTSPLLTHTIVGPLNTKPKPEDMSKLDEEISGNLDQIGYGSFHQQYRVNGKLVAVGVIDILNNCVSSVYFFYDPEYYFLNMGTYSALREIALVRQLNKLDPSIKYYYLGFYVHSCRKMRYKGLFYPSYLCCPEVYTWHPIEECIVLCDKARYNRFAPRLNEATPYASTDKVEIFADQDANESIQDVRIKIKFKDNEIRVLKFDDFCRLLNENFVPQFRRLIEGYCKLFGKTFSRRVLIKF